MILVTGATGHVGGEMARQLVAAGVLAEYVMAPCLTSPRVGRSLEPWLKENRVHQQRAVLTSTFALECDTSCRESVRGMVCDSLESQVV
jgi:nucleoside-diphosphate-sugar epimerase